jgi:hypothetical protein
VVLFGMFALIVALDVAWQERKRRVVFRNDP